MLDGAPAAEISTFRELLLGMSYADPEVRRLLDLEGLKQWVPGRTEGYALLARPWTVRYLDAFVEAVSQAMRVDLEDLGFDRGGALLVKRALAVAAVPDRRSRSQARLRICWSICGPGAGRRGTSSSTASDAARAVIVKGVAADQRWSGAERAGARRSVR